MFAKLCLYLAVINVGAFAIYAFDKHAAGAGWWRVKEGTLLMLAAVGGSIGAVAAQQLLRHKTRKEPFRTLLLLICVLQPVAAVAAWLYLA